MREDVDEDLTSQKIQEQIEGNGIIDTPRTIRRRLNEASFKYSKLLLTEHHKRKHLIWAISLRNYNWNQVMATNETMFRLHDVKCFLLTTFI